MKIMRKITVGLVGIICGWLFASGSKRWVETTFTRGIFSSTTTTPNAEDVILVDELFPISDLSRGVSGDHTVVLKRDGTIWAWGANLFGQLGDGSYIPPPVRSPGPPQQPNNSPFPVQEATKATDWVSIATVRSSHGQLRETASSEDGGAILGGS